MPDRPRKAAGTRRLLVALIVLLSPGSLATGWRPPGAAPPRRASAGLCSAAPGELLVRIAQQTQANACCTPYASCPLAAPTQIGAPCTCPSPYGPVNGTACHL